MKRSQPFDPTRPAGDDVFVGRTEIVGAFTMHLRHQRSVALTAPTGLGKTSVLQAISRSLASDGPEGEIALPVYVRCERRWSEPGEVLAAIAGGVAQALGPRRDSRCPADVEAAARAAAHAGRMAEALGRLLDWSFESTHRLDAPVILLDDVHRLPTECLGRVASSLYDPVDRRQLTVALAGKRALLVELRNDVSVLKSLLAEHRELAPFTREETGELVARAGELGHAVEPGFTEAAQARTGGHPYKLHAHLAWLISRGRPLTSAALDVACKDPQVVAQLRAFLPDDPTGSETPAPGSVAHVGAPPRGHGSTLGHCVDFGIITIREDEFEAVLDRFPPFGSVEGRRIYNLHRLELLHGESYSIAIVKCIEQGNTEALDAARDLLEELVPQWLLVVGIAGALPSDEFTLGDVVVSTRINDYSVEAILQDKGSEYAMMGGPVHKDSAKIVANLRALKAKLQGWNSPASIVVPRPSIELDEELFYGHEDWKKKTRKALDRHAARTEPLVLSGAIGASDRLIKDTKILASFLLQVARQVLVVEMESAGVYRAATGRQVPSLAIRGVSDVVGFKRDSGWTKYACHSAAAFTYAFLRARPIHPRIPR